MSFLKRLFGGSDGAAQSGPGKPAKVIEYNGYSIAATPYKAEGGQFQTSGMVSKHVEGVLKEHKFIRADRFALLDDAIEVSLNKGRQLVDQMGDRLFDR